jgi:hypothetical protein
MRTKNSARPAPSPTEIRDRCRQLQARWSYDERLRRAGIVLGSPLTMVPPEWRLLSAISRQQRSHREGAAA